MLTTIIITAYNEEATIRQVIEAVGELPLDKQIVVVENGSTDGTRALLRKLAGTHAIQVVYNDVNIGKGHGVRLGLRHAKGEIIAFQDADVELDPQDLVPLVRAVESGEADVAFGSRFLQQDQHFSLLYYYGNVFLSRVAGVLLGRRLSDVETCYKVFRRDLIAIEELESDRFDLDIEIAFKLLRGRPQLKYLELPIRFRPRNSQQGKKIKMRDGFQALSAMFKYRRPA